MNVLEDHKIIIYMTKGIGMNMCLDEVLDEPLPKEVECYMLARKILEPNVKRVREGMWVAVENMPITGRIVRLKNGKLSDGEIYLIERDDGVGWNDVSSTPTENSLYWMVYKDELVKLEGEVKPKYVTAWLQHPCPIGEEVIAEEVVDWDKAWGYPYGFHRFEKPPRELVRGDYICMGDCIIRGILKDIVAVGLQYKQKVYVGRRWTSLEEVE